MIQSRIPAVFSAADSAKISATLLISAEFSCCSRPSPVSRPPDRPGEDQSNQSQGREDRITDLESIVDLHLHELALFAVVVPPRTLTRTCICTRPRCRWISPAAGIDPYVAVWSFPVDHMVKPSWQTAWCFGVDVGAHHGIAEFHPCQRG